MKQKMSKSDEDRMIEMLEVGDTYMYNTKRSHKQRVMALQYFHYRENRYKGAY